MNEKLAAATRGGGGMPYGAPHIACGWTKIAVLSSTAQETMHNSSRASAFSEIVPWKFLHGSLSKGLFALDSFMSVCLCKLVNLGKLKNTSKHLDLVFFCFSLKLFNFLSRREKFVGYSQNLYF